MKMHGYPKTEIAVHGKDNKLCGSEKESCNFQGEYYDTNCILFKKTLILDENDNCICCKKCVDSFGMKGKDFISFPIKDNKEKQENKNISISFWLPYFCKTKNKDTKPKLKA